MTAQFTQTGIILPSNLMADALSSKTNVNYSLNTDQDAFSSALDNATKSYADKTENKTDYTTNNKDYSKNTKNIDKSNNHNEVKDNYDSKKSQSNEENKNDKTIKDKNTDDKISEEKNIEDSSSKDSKVEQDKNITTEDKDNEKTPEKNSKELGEAALKDVEQLLKEIQDNSIVDKTAKVDIEKTSDIDNADSTIKTVSQTQEQNTKNIVNEKILANIDYSDETGELNLEKIKNLSPEELKKILENVQTTKDTTNQTSQTTAQSAQTPEAVIENIKTDTADNNVEVKTEIKTDIKTEVDTSKLADNIKTQENTIKTAKENLAADTARLTANIEQVAQETPVKTVTPSDTQADETPVIKVTDEVASQIKDNSSTGVENKDNTSKIKDKAVQTMTSLQDKDTTVTESKTANSNSNSNNSQNQGNTNAAETAAKLSVDQSTVNFNQSNGAEVFVNKLDAQLNAMKNSSNQAKTLNQTDIMSQVTAKFEQLQQQGTNKVSIVLQPENLGKVSVEIMNSKDGVVAKMTTDSQQVKELFDKNVEALKSNLSSQGVNVNNIKVECTQESANNAMNFERDQFNQAFNQQQGQNHTNQSNQNSQTTYGTDYNVTADTDTEAAESNELKNSDSIIKHNGKVDYTV